VATTSKGCSQRGANVAVNVHGFHGEILAQPNDEQLKSGELTLFTTSIEASSYEWTLDENVVRRDKEVHMIYNYPDTTLTVSLQVGDEFGCSQYFEKQYDIVDVDGIYSLDSTAIQDDGQLQHVVENRTTINVYPNPLFGDEVTISFQSAVAESVLITIYNSGNRRMGSVTVECQVGQNEFLIPVPGELQGIYFLQLISPSLQDIIPLIKQ
jgi:hypothetical protein